MVLNCCRRAASRPALSAGLAVLANAAVITTASITMAVPASAGPAKLPQPTAASAGAAWLAAQVNAAGYVGGSTPNYSSTAQTALALASTGTEAATAERAVAYLAGNVQAYVQSGGVDGPGQLALLILDAEAVGDDPTSFGGTNLVARLLATEQTTGTKAGLFGTSAQLRSYSAGVYPEGLALAALAAAGVKGTSAVRTAEHWLTDQQCPDGGWSYLGKSGIPCTGTPADYSGPDTNSTALAVEGLAAEGALTAKASVGARRFFSAGQDPDAGWSYYPNTAATPATTDPDSTALVIQALVALGVTPSAPAWAKGTADPVSALLSFQITSGSGTGAFVYPPAATANLIATYQAVPALEGPPLP